MTTKRNTKLKLLITTIFLLLIITFIGTSCACPLFSFVERITGFDIKTGKEIDQSLVDEELIYPGSMVLAQVEGNISEVLDLIDKYGGSFSDADLSILEDLPQDIRDEEFTTTIYSTPDNEMEVLDYYDSLNIKGWLILNIEEMTKSSNSGQGTVLLALKEEYKQAFLLAETQNNTFIIFLNIDLELLLEMQN